jgi:N-acetylglucosamine-6-phosphate deacetylase
MRYALVNGQIYTGDEIINDKSVVIADQHIQAIIDPGELTDGTELIDLQGKIIAPGFIDIQVNGGGGALFNDDPSAAAIATIFNAHKRYGTTNFLPTLITTSIEKMEQSIQAVKTCMDNEQYGVLGLHLEGPYLSQEKPGVHDPAYIRPLQEAELNILLGRGQDIIKLLTVAPEKVETHLLQRIVEAGIKVAAGHSNATYEQAKESFGQGVSLLTHLFNAMSLFGSREPGLVGAYLDSNEDVYASVIADGYHVHYGSISICAKLKQQRLLLVTDAMPPVGMGDLDFTLGQYHIHTKAGKCTNEAGVLAGSALDMASAVRNCVEHVGIPVEEALRMASTYVADFLGLTHLGKIAPQNQANLVILDQALTVKAVVCNGKYEDIS